MKRTSTLSAFLSLALLGCGAVSIGMAAGAALKWHQGEGYLELKAGDRPVVRYMHAHDTSTDERKHETYKPYLHVYDPAGKQFITKGPGGQFSHHRGIFIGWNKLTHNGKSFDTWHMTTGSMVHDHFEATEVSGDDARMVAVINWYGGDKENPLIVETRETIVHTGDDPNVLTIDVTSKLKAVRGEVYLDGDPEHAGLQFRASNDLSEQAKAKTGQAQYTFHEEGIDPRKDADLPWVLMSYTLDGTRFNVQHMNHPSNPRGTVYSAYRDYGRFGAFFRHRIADGQTLTLQYRLRITTGDAPSREALDAQYAAWTK